jgi:hypothetical protein
MSLKSLLNEARRKKALESKGKGLAFNFDAEFTEETDQRWELSDVFR